MLELGGSAQHVCICMHLSISAFICVLAGLLNAKVLWATCPTAFKLRDELKNVVDNCLKETPVGDCSTEKYGPIAEWDVSHVSDMSDMFRDADLFNSDISKWDVSEVTDTYRMFFSARSFNSDISKWDVSKVNRMLGMFEYAESFNGDISKWDVSKVTDMLEMFYFAESFNGDISKWDVSKVTDMKWMFSSAISFNVDISKWDVSKVTNMREMFWGARSFNHKLCGKAWVKSKAPKHRMFDLSSGSISTICGLCSIVVILILFLRNPVTSSSQHNVVSYVHLTFFFAVIMLPPTRTKKE